MIEIEVVGRLGNQMFQYAFARALQEKKNGEPINLCFRQMTNNDGFTNSLADFNVSPFHSHNKTHPSIIQKFIMRIFIEIKRIMKIQKRVDEHIYELKWQKLLNFFGIYWLTQGYYNFPISNSKNTILVGHFESAQYFNSIRNVLINEFTPIHDKLPSNYDLYNKIESTESVCVSMRRGDFLSDSNIKNAAFVCDICYFFNGIETMKKKVKNPVFFIFSDDIGWVKEKVKFGADTIIYFENGDDPLWEKMRLMYSCKHFVISNSTFSWWAQYLSRNDNKIVIAPSRWRNYECKLDIYEPHWLLIDV